MGPTPVRHIQGWSSYAAIVRNEFTAVIERDDDWYIAFSPEVPGANGQGRTPDEAKTSLAEAIALILEVRREDGRRDLAADAERPPAGPQDLPHA